MSRWANGSRYRFREKIKLVLKATRQHARNLSTFAIVYKASMIVLRNLNFADRGKESRYDSFFAGLLGGYAVFGRQPGSVSQQVSIHEKKEILQEVSRCLDCHLCLRASNALSRQTRRPTQHAPPLLPHYSRGPRLYHKQRLARLRQLHLGVCHVHFPLVPGDPGIESTE